MTLTKVSGGILDPGINVAGIVTATGFDGPFTGGTGTNINAGIITATGFDLNGNGDISGNLVVGGNLTANGDFTTLNTTLREVELLRVDANSSVAAGIITQTGAGHGLVLADDTTLKMAMNVGSGIATFRALNASYGNHNSASGIFQQVNLNTAAVTFGNTISVNGATITTGNGSHRIRSAANDFAIEHTTNSYKGFRILGNVPENTLVVDDGNSGSVGIGTNNPLQKLHIADNTSANIYIETKNSTTGSTAGIYYKTSSSAASDFFKTGIVLEDDGTSYARGKLHILQNNTAGNANATLSDSVVTFTQDGKVGIGTDNPDRMLHILGTGNAIVKMEADYSGSVTGIEGVLTSSGANRYVTGIYGKVINTSGSESNVASIRLWNQQASPTTSDSPGYITFNTTSDGANTATEKVRINSYGQVGINTTVGGKLSVAVDSSSTNALATGFTALTLKNTNTTDDTSVSIDFNNSVGGIVGRIGAQFKDTSDKDTDLYFATRANSGVLSEALRITSDGNITFGSQTGSAVAVTSSAIKNLNLGSDYWNGTKGDYRAIREHIFYINPNDLYGFGISLNMLEIQSQQNIGFFAGTSGGGTGRREERLRITSAGLVGIGTDNPQKQLEIHGNADTCLRIVSSAGGVASLQLGDTADHIKGAITFKNDDNSLRIRGHNNDDRIIITSDGKAIFSEEIETPQDYPNFRPTLDFNFAAEKKLDPRITYTRTGPASFTDEFGKVILVGENHARFDHDPTTRECKGLLIEEERTNNNKSSVYQNNFTGWTLSQFVSQEYSSETAPDGSSNMILVSANVNNSHHYAYISHPGDTLTGARTISAWFKKLGTTTYYPQLRIFGSGNGISYANFTLTGDGSVNSGGSATTAATITRYPNDWYRCTLSWNTNSTHYGGGIAISPNDSAELPTFAGDADITKGFLVYGFQDEAGANPSSYIPTYGRTQTRGDDDLIIDGEDFTDFLNPSEGTIFADYKVIAEDPEIMYLSDGTAARRIGLYEAGSSQTRFLIGNSGTLADTTDSAGTTVGDNIKAAGAYKLNDVAAAKNGVISSTDSSVTIPPDLDRAYIGGYYDGTVQGILGLRRLVYYQQRLPNSQLVTLTA